MDIRDKVQIDAIKDREEYSICDYGTHVLIYNGTYGVYIPEEDMMLNSKRYEKNEDITRLDPYDVEKKKIVVVMDAEGNAIGIIKTMADIEAQKNDTYTI